LLSAGLNVEKKPDAAAKPVTAQQANSRNDNLARVEMKAEESRPTTTATAAATPGYRPMDSGTATIAIDKNSKFTGHLKFAGTIAVDGTVEGEVVAEKVVVHDGGAVNAKVESDSVMVAGTVKGDIFAKKEIEVAASGNLTGNVTAPAFLVRPGGSFEGKCSIGRRSS